MDVHGSDCEHYDPTTKRILIIKLGALGDVIRTTPLLHAIKAAEPHSQIWWLTQSPEILPRSIDVIVPFTLQGLVGLRGTKFDAIYNLDKDREACALAATLSGQVKKGFILRDGKCVPTDDNALHKYMTGIFDDISKANTKSYQQEIFEMCGFEFRGERYDMPALPVTQTWKLPKKKPIVGLNTGCGGRWTSRLWPDKFWISLAKNLKRSGYEPLLLGGEQEHKKNLRLARLSGARYLGHFPLPQFMSLVNECALVVTAVSMAVHITIGLNRRIVLFNNIFNKNEFELYGLGEILEPDFECSCYYSPTCPNNCMQYLTVDVALAACERQLRALPSR